MNAPDAAAPSSPGRPAGSPEPDISVDAGWAPTQLIARAPQGAGPAMGNALPPGTRLGEFEVKEVLGEGGFGIVYLAYDNTLRRRVAVKEYMPATLAERGADLQVVVGDERQRGVYVAGLTGFVNEARMLAQFDHPALVKVHRFWQANGTAYMVMPFYQGTTLKKVLAGMGGAPDERWLLALLHELTGALAVIHGEHCYHRDIAPDNILLLADTGKPLLLDFGAARQVIGDATQQLTAILKPGYAPIEQYAEVASMKQGPWTDVYALCAVVYAAITGLKPPVAVGRTVNDSYVPLMRAAAGRYSQGFLQAIDHGLRLRPDERPLSMAALRRELGLESDIRLDIPLAPTPMADDIPPTEVLPRRAPEAPAAAPERTHFMGAAAARPAAAGSKPMPVVAPVAAPRADRPRPSPATTPAPRRQPAASNEPGRLWWIVGGAAAAAVALAVAAWFGWGRGAPGAVKAAEAPVESSASPS